MSHSSSTLTPSKPGTVVLAPLVAIVFIGFLSIGAPLPALSLYVHDQLGFGALAVGCAISAQSVATVVTRHWGGTLCDTRGARRAVLMGLPIGAVAGLLYLASALLPLDPAARLAILLVGRVVLGLGESLFMTGAMSWGISRLGPARTGTVMSWQGIAMYAALGLGAPLGLAVQATAGFAGVAVLTLVLPLLALGIALALPGVPATGGSRAPFHRVLSLIWRPGLVLTLATVPYAAMATFLPLDYAAHGWTGAGFGLLGFGGGYILVRLFGSHLPDRVGGVLVAAVSLALEAVAQTILWTAPTAGWAMAGAVLTGVGFSLVFPSMGVEATRRVPADQRGRAVGNFIAFFDVAVGLTGPIVGIATAALGYQGAFLAGALASLAALAALAGVHRMRPSA